MRHRCLLGAREISTLAKSVSIDNHEPLAKSKLELLASAWGHVQRGFIFPILSFSSLCKGDARAADRQLSALSSPPAGLPSNALSIKLQAQAITSHLPGPARDCATTSTTRFVPVACPWISVSGLYAWSMPLLARASLNVGCSTPYAACAGYSGGRRTGLPRQTVMKSWQVRAGYRGGRPEWPQCSWRASHGAAISTPSCGRLCKSPVTRSLTRLSRLLPTKER